MAGSTDGLQQLVNKVYTTRLRVSTKIKIEIQCIGRERHRDEDHVGK